MPCFFKKQKRTTANLINYHQRSALRALSDIYPAEDYSWVMDSQKGIFTIKHLPTEKALVVNETKSLDYWIAVLTTIQQLEDTIEILSYQR